MTDDISYSYGGAGLDPGMAGMGSGLVPPALQPNTLTLSPDFSDATARNRPQQFDASGLRRTITNPLAPPVSTAAAPASVPSPTNFDLAGGDSISVMQYTSRMNPKVTPPTNRIWGVEGPQYNANNPAPFGPWETGAVGDPPNRIRDRYKYLLQQNPGYFNGINNMFLTIGSNDPSQLDAVKETLGMLKQANPNMHVVVPGMGPGVPDSEVMNKALQSAVEGAGYTFFQPKIQWAKDGVHPANSQAMFNQANAALNAVRPPAAPTTATTPPSGLQPGGALSQPPPNALAPGLPGQPMGAPQPTARAPIGAAPTGTPYTFGDAIKRFEGPSLTVYNDIGGGKPTIGYGHTILPGEENLKGGINEQQQEEIFQKDLQASLDGVSKWGKGIDLSKLTDNQREVLASYYYNTGKLPTGIDEKIAAGDIKGASEMIRNGIKTGVGVGYLPQLDMRRNAEADMFMLPDGQHPNLAAIGRGGGYSSGQRVPGTGYAVGGAAAGVTAPPSQVGLGSPFAVPDNPFAPRPPGVPGGPAQDLAELNQRDRMMRALQMWGMLSGIAKGIKFTPVPITYDPFKAAGERVQVHSGPVVAPPEMQAPSFRAEPLPPHAAPITPMPVSTPGVSVRRKLDSGI